MEFILACDVKIESDFTFFCVAIQLSPQLTKMLFFASINLKGYLYCISNLHMHLGLFLDFHQSVHQYCIIVITEALKYA